MYPNRITEPDIQRKMEKQTGGKHMACKSGVADIVTDYELIEIKNWNVWKSAIGQLQSYDFDLPGRNLRVHFFGKIPDLAERTHIISVFTKQMISVTWEFEDIKKCDFTCKEYKCDEIIRLSDRFCKKCLEKPEIKELLIQENILTNRDRDIIKYTKMCSVGNISVLETLKYKMEIFDQLSHPLLFLLILKIL